MVKWLGADQASLVACGTAVLLAGAALAADGAWGECAAVVTLAVLCAAQSSGVEYAVSGGRDGGIGAMWWVAAPCRLESMAVLIVPLWCAAGSTHSTGHLRLLTALVGAYYTAAIRLADRVTCNTATPYETSFEAFATGAGFTAAALLAIANDVGFEALFCGSVTALVTIAAQMAYPAAPTSPLRVAVAALGVFLSDLSAVEQNDAMRLVQWSALGFALAVGPAYNLLVFTYQNFEMLIAPPFSHEAVEKRMFGAGGNAGAAGEPRRTAAPFTDPKRYPARPSNYGGSAGKRHGAPPAAAPGLGRSGGLGPSKKPARVPDFGTRPAAASTGEPAASQETFSNRLDTKGMSFKEQLALAREEFRGGPKPARKAGLGQARAAARARREAAEAGLPYAEAEEDTATTLSAADAPPRAGPGVGGSRVVREGDQPDEVMIEYVAPGAEEQAARAKAMKGAVPAASNDDDDDDEDIVEIGGDATPEPVGMMRAARGGLRRGHGLRGARAGPRVGGAKSAATAATGDARTAAPGGDGDAAAAGTEDATPEERETLLQQRLQKHAEAAAGNVAHLSRAEAAALARPARAAPKGSMRVVLTAALACGAAAVWYTVASAMLRGVRHNERNPVRWLVPDPEQGAVYLLMMLLTALGATSTAAVMLLCVVAMDSGNPGLYLAVAGLAVVQTIFQRWETGPLMVAAAPLLVLYAFPPPSATALAVLYAACIHAGVFFTTTDESIVVEPDMSAAGRTVRLKRVAIGGGLCATALNIWAMWSPTLGVLLLTATFAALPVLASPVPRVVLRAVPYQMYAPVLFVLFHRVFGLDDADADPFIS